MNKNWQIIFDYSTAEYTVLYKGKPQYISYSADMCKAWIRRFSRRIEREEG
jgi:hypothetical protein